MKNAHPPLAQRSCGLTATVMLLGSALLPLAAQAAPDGKAATALLQKSGCTACHNAEQKLVGPSFKDVAAKYADRKDAVSYLTGKIRAGGAGVWGPIPMPAQSISEADAKSIAEWLAAGAPK